MEGDRTEGARRCGGDAALIREGLRGGERELLRDERRAALWENGERWCESPKTLSAIYKRFSKTGFLKGLPLKMDTFSKAGLH
jgi:hypothetical protein